MISSPKDFDLILVIGYFRSALPMLSIVRYLSPKFRIGLRFQPLNSQMEAKTGDAQRLFEHLCIDAGGVRCVVGSPATCLLMLVQQYPYTDSFVTSVQADIKAKETWGMLTLASMGLDVHDAFLKQFDVTGMTVPDKGLADFLINIRNAKSRYQELEMIEVGLPFKKYPVFEEFSVDWIVAAPTLFSFHTEVGKQRFLRDVLKLLEQTPANDVVAYKSHNGNAKDYFTPRLHVQVAKIISLLRISEVWIETLIRRMPTKIRPQMAKVLTALLHLRLMRRVVPMPYLTSKADMSIEAFLPGVRKGVIGGESNTIWGALFMGLPYYNCVQAGERNAGKSELIKKSGDKVLVTNLKYFGVPYCNAQITPKAESQMHRKIPPICKSIVDVIENKLSLKALTRT